MKNRGSKKPLFFFLAAVLILYSAAFLRAVHDSGYYNSEEFASFYEKYRASNPGEFDYALYLKAMDVTDAEERKALKTRDPLLETPAETFLLDLREDAAGILGSNMTSHDAGIVSAMLLGDKSTMEEETGDLYRGSGISHLLAVSGLHVSLIGLGLFSFLRKRAGLGVRPACGISAVFVAAYVLFTGASASSLRAGTMFLLSMAGKVTGRKSDTLTSLSAAAIWLLLWRPYLITQSGFLLSFSAISGIILSGKLAKEEASGKKDRESRISIKRDLPEIRRKAGEALKVCLCVTLATLPAVACSYYKAPVYSVLINMAVIPLMTAVFVSGAAVLAFGIAGLFLQGVPVAGALLSFLAKASAAPGHYILLFYEKLAEASLKLPGAVVILGRPENGRVLVYCILLIAVIRFLSAKQRTKICLPVLCGFYLLAFLILRTGSENGIYVTALDVGQGDCFHIHTETEDILIDCGSTGNEWAGSGIAENYFLSKGITELDYAVVSHADSDHTNGIIYLLSDESSVKINNILLPYLASEDSKYDGIKEAAGSIPLNYCSRGTCIKGREYVFSCIYAEEDISAMEDTNRESSVWLFQTDNFSMLFTGDITEQEEKKICALNNGIGNVNILKCAHHGSATATSENFLDMLEPDAAVLSYGAGNRYGHPSEDVTESLESRNIRIFSTAECGAVTIRPGGKQYRIETFF